ncbi:hypothetical protein UlMin_040047 [Ulmus minor]
MKIKNKGKVYPSPSSSSSSSNDGEVLSVLNLLPAAILALASVLSLEDREVLAYLITRSLKTSSSSSSSNPSESKKNSSKKAPNNAHKPPMFDCDCFDCYTSYWVRWDSSPNRELIHQVIEAFEDHLFHGEKSKKNGRGKRKEKNGRREAPKLADVTILPENASPEKAEPENDVAPAAGDGCEGENDSKDDVVEAREEDVAVVVRTMTANDHKGLARKVLPDVLGLLNSRLWSLWSPNA